MPPAPVKHVRVDIDADRPILSMPADPLTADGSGAAKILAQTPGRAPAQQSKTPLEEVHLRLGTLHCALIEPMRIGRGGKTEVAWIIS